MSTVTLKQMEGKLLTLDHVHTRLSATEPLVTTLVSSEQDIRFRLEPDWATGLDASDPTEGVGMFMSVDGTETQVTKEAAVQAAGNFGLSGAYIKKVPAHFIEGLLNYHYGNGMGDHAYNALSVGGKVSAFSRPTTVPFSNLALVESVAEGIHERYGADTPIFADYKMGNTLQQTNVRLIVPGEQRVIEDGGLGDVPANEADSWLRGVHISNSLIGKTQTRLEAYMFRFWCTNGATTSLEGIGSWNRKVNGQQDDVFEWARTQVDEILGGMEVAFDAVQALTELNVQGNTGEVLREIYAQFEVPVSQREEIGNILLGFPNPTLYTVMNAITSVANGDGLEDRRADRLMRIGGAIPTETFDPLKARVYREGQHNPAGPNPYEIRRIAAQRALAS